MQHSLIVRIYRRETQHSQHGVNELIYGIVENIDTSKTEAFSNKDELWRLISSEVEDGMIKNL